MKNKLIAIENKYDEMFEFADLDYEIPISLNSFIGTPLENFVKDVNSVLTEEQNAKFIMVDANETCDSDSIVISFCVAWTDKNGSILMHPIRLHSAY